MEQSIYLYYIYLTCVCVSSSTDQQPAIAWRLRCCLWVGTHSSPPSALETQSHLTQGNSPNPLRYTLTPLKHNYTDNDKLGTAPQQKHRLNESSIKKDYRLEKSTRHMKVYRIEMTLLLHLFTNAVNWPRIYCMRPASERPVQPRSQCYKWRGWQFNTKGSPPHAGCVLSPKHHSHIQGKICLSINISHGMWFECHRQSVWPVSFFFFFSPVGHSISSFLHSIGQHRAGAARQSLCWHRSEIQLEWFKRLLEKGWDTQP